MLFQRGPKVLYNYTDKFLDPKIYTAANLWRRNDIKDDYLSSLVLMDEYLIRSGDTPESVSFDFYGRVDFGWAIMVANDVTNYHEQWPRTSTALSEYVYSKYENPAAVMMYETTEVTDALQRKIVKAGMRVITSGEGKVFSPNLLVGNIVQDSKGQLRIKLAAQLKDLSYLRILIKNNTDVLSQPGSLVTD